MERCRRPTFVRSLETTKTLATTSSSGLCPAVESYHMPSIHCGVLRRLGVRPEPYASFFFRKLGTPMFMGIVT